MEDDVKYFYIPGFNSSGRTLNMLKADLPNLEQLTYDVNRPEWSLNNMQDIVNMICPRGTEVIIIASSLGGWFAEQVVSGNVYNHVDLVLFNPSVNAETSIEKYGISKDVLLEYQDLKDKLQINRSCGRYVITSVDDEIVSSKDVCDFYEKIAMVVRTEGGHRMNDSFHKDLLLKIINMAKNNIN